MGCGASSEAPACPAQALRAPAAGSDSAGADDAAGSEAAASGGETRPAEAAAATASSVDPTVMTHYLQRLGLGEAAAARCAHKCIVASISSQAAFESLETSDIAALGFTAAEVETVTRELNQRSAEEQLMVERALAESMQELVSGQDAQLLDEDAQLAMALSLSVAAANAPVAGDGSQQTAGKRKIRHE